MFQSPSLRGSGRFRHREARRREDSRVPIPFIAGQWSLRGGAHRRLRRRRVSIPFIAGQWSLLESPIPPHGGGAKFQSPSLRGSGRFVNNHNLLIEVVLLFQSPSLRGSGRFSAADEAARDQLLVSIPFIAGQWSLPRRMAEGQRRKKCFNPLHCGAVVASIPSSRSRRWAEMSFNPLHCGAVVASRRARGAGRRRRCRFQSPSLRGSGRFKSARHPHRGGRRVSIPFIAGQWSLRVAGSAPPQRRVEFQSPSLRGSGRFKIEKVEADAESLLVSIPFIAGQWSLRTG